MGKKIVINGQSASIECNGGSGKYAQEIYQGLMGLNGDASVNFDVHPINYKGIEQQERSEENLKTDLLRFVKHAMFRSLPPVVFDKLQSVYSSVGSLKNGIDFSEGLGPVCEMPDWYNSQASILLHELTNYGTCNEIGRINLSPKLILAVTFHDIQDYFYPDYFQDKSLKSRRMAYSFYKDRADFFFAVSEFTKKTMVEQLGINPLRIKVTHLAADDLLILKPSHEVDQWAESFGRFLIYPAKMWKHKNHDFLFNALGKRRDELKSAGMKLLLTGGFNQVDTQYINTLLGDTHLESIVEVLGFVSDEQLQALLRKAEFLVFPSLFEGFGMPILEAMTLGCPVLSSTAGSLPEIGGDAAMYFDPKNEDEFIGLVDSVCSGHGIDRVSMINRGLDNCKRFSWNRTINETVKVYKELLQ